MMCAVMCPRCGQVADDESDDFKEWEAFGTQVICPACVTKAEEQAKLVERR